MGRVIVRYVAANSRASLPKGSKNLAMDAFLMSDEVQDLADHVAEDIASDARRDAADAGLIRSGDYIRSFHVAEGEPIIIRGNPRRTSVVYNSSDHAPALEFGNSRTQAHHILYRAGIRYHTLKRF